MDVALEVGTKTFYAGAFMDKVPLLLVGTCGTSLDGEPVRRDRVEYSPAGGFTRTSYNVSQPGMHDTYRKNFNGVDLFNRDCFGELSLQHAVRTKLWARRLFLALFGMCETNALNAYRAVVGPMTRFEWLLKLADKLINNPYLTEEHSDQEEAAPQPHGRYGDCGNQIYTQHHRKCSMCELPTHWACPCGTPCCRAGESSMNKNPKNQAPKCNAYFLHLRDVFKGC